MTNSALSQHGGQTKSQCPGGEVRGGEAQGWGFPISPVSLLLLTWVRSFCPDTDDALAALTSIG